MEQWIEKVSQVWNFKRVFEITLAKMTEIGSFFLIKWPFYKFRIVEKYHF
jgi:hypothetical protein